MKKNILILALLVSFGISCKSSKDATKAETKTETNSTPKVTGKVSHQYNATGCATVIIIPATAGGSEMTLIPSVKLDSKFDVDGMQISFNYITLRMPQPAGCTVGMPAEIKDITSSK